MSTLPEIDLGPPEPTAWERFSAKFKKEPLVPIGAGLTTIALIGASRSLKRGDSGGFNVWLRYRVGFQGFTILAALFGSLYYSAANRPQPAPMTFEELEAKRKAAEDKTQADRAERVRLAELGASSSSVPLPEERAGGRGVKHFSPEEKEALRQEAEEKRAMIRRSMAKAAKEEGRAVRLPTD